MVRFNKAFITAAVVVCAIGLALVIEARSRATGEVKGQQLLVADLAGEPGKEVDMQVYTFPPGASVPWHIHADAHEFDYELDGTLTLNYEGQESKALKRGEAVYVPPNVVHRGVNLSRTQPARVVVVRVKPKDQPLTTEVKP
jgi:quercetin dioxygenase-like cupin family protein